MARRGCKGASRSCPHVLSYLESRHSRGVSIAVVATLGEHWVLPALGRAGGRLRQIVVGPRPSEGSRRVGIRQVHAEAMTVQRGSGEWLEPARPGEAMGSPLSA